MIISSCFLSESDSDSDYRAEFTNKTACNRGGKETKWQVESYMMMAECVEKNTEISDDFRNLQKFVKKIKTLFWINAVILQRKSWTGDVKSI